MAGSNVVGSLLNLGVRAGEAVVGIGTKLMSGGTFKTLLENAGKFVSNTAQLIIGGLKNIDLSNIRNNILSIVSPESIAKVTNLIKSAGERLRDIVPNLTNGLFNGNIGERITQILQNVKSIDPLNIVSGITDRISKIRENLNPGDGIIAIDPTKIGWFGEFLNGKYQSIQERFAGFQGKLQELGITGIVSEKMEEAKSQLGQSFEQFKQQFPTLGNFLEKVSENAEAIDQAQGQGQAELQNGSPDAGVLPASQPLGEGKVTNIPSSVNTGIMANYTQNYGTRKWGYNQKKMQQAYHAAGSQTDGNMAMINGRYLVATTTKIGNVGDNIDVTLANGEVVHAVIADAKNPKDSNYSTYGHVESGQVDVVEWEINGTSQAQLKNNLQDKGWYGEKVVSVTNYGSGGYF